MLAVKPKSATGSSPRSTALDVDATVTAAASPGATAMLSRIRRLLDSCAALTIIVFLLELVVLYSSW
jgi:hypothetical protein